MTANFWDETVVKSLRYCWLKIVNWSKPVRHSVSRGIDDLPLALAANAANGLSHNLTGPVCRKIGSCCGSGRGREIAVEALDRRSGCARE